MIILNLSKRGQRLMNALEIAACVYGAKSGINETNKDIAAASLGCYMLKLERKIRRLESELRKANEGTTPKHLKGNS